MGTEGGAATESGTAITPDAGTTGSVSSEANFGDVISSIQAGKSNADQLGTLTDISKVKVVQVGELVTGENATAIETALSENKEQVTELQQVQPSSVFATKMEADGAVTVFVQ